MDKAQKIFLTNQLNHPSPSNTLHYPILRHHQFSIETGEIIAIDDGIRLNQQFLGEIPHRPKKHKKLAYFNAKSEGNLTENATVWKNLKCVYCELKLPLNDFSKKFEELSLYFPFLSAQSRTKVQQLSPLNRNLLALCRELIKQPDLLVLDEPSDKMGVQDAETFYEALFDLKRHAKSPFQNMSILLNEQTHIYHNFELADTWQYLDDGQLCKVSNFSPLDYD